MSLSKGLINTNTAISMTAVHTIISQFYYYYGLLLSGFCNV